MRILSLPLCVLMLSIYVPSGRGLQLGRNYNRLDRKFLNSNRLRANPVDDMSDLQTAAHSSRFPVQSFEVPKLVFQISVGMFFLSAPLGMMLDNYHGKSESSSIFLGNKLSVTDFRP